MNIEIIPKKAEIPAFDTKAIKIQHIKYFDHPYTEYEGEKITEEVIARVLHKIPLGLNVYLSLEPDGEDRWLEVNCDGNWLSLWYWSEEREESYFLYNSAFADTEKQVRDGDLDPDVCCPLLSGGQSPIAKLNAITDIETGVKAVEYFIRTGEFYPGLDWWHEH